LEAVKVGLLGLGTVGGGTATVLQRNAEEIQRRVGRAIEIIHVAGLGIADQTIVDPAKVTLTEDAFEVVNNPEVDIVVELIGGYTLAKDLVQETSLRAWKALDSLKDNKAAKSWLITILRREYARTFERKVPKFTDVETVVVPEDRELEPDDRTEVQLLRQGIMQLADKYRQPLLLQVVMGYSCAEIADQLGISKSAVMTQLFRAREKLKTKLQQDGVTGNVHELF